jgi:hypothetical protein
LPIVQTGGFLRPRSFQSPIIKADNETPYGRYNYFSRSKGKSLIRDISRRDSYPVSYRDRVPSAPGLVAELEEERKREVYLPEGACG